MTKREQIVELVNKLFIYTDDQKWDKLQSEVFAEEVDFDMTSAGGEVAGKTARQICADWKKGFEGLDAINHLAGNYLIDIKGNTAEVFAYATATHFKNSAKNGKTREFVGSYDLQLTGGEGKWRINRFIYHLKYMNGNIDLS